MFMEICFTGQRGHLPLHPLQRGTIKESTPPEVDNEKDTLASGGSDYLEGDVSNDVPENECHMISTT